MSKKTILIVEDSSDARVLYRRALESETLHIEAVADGELAIEHLSTKPLPDLIMLDLTLPDIPGEELLAKIKANPSWLKVKTIIVSGKDGLDEIAKATGADGFVVKPIDLDDLYTVIDRVLA